MKTRITLVLLLFTQIVSAQIVQTITTNAFQQKGSELQITFDVPYNTTKLTYNIRSVFVKAGDKNVEAKTIKGDIQNLETGESYTISWNVLADVFELASPESAEINLEYTADSKKVADNIAEQERKAQEEQDKLTEIRRRKQERRERKPFTMGIVGYGGATFGTFENTDTDLMSEMGFGYGAGVELEFRLGNGTYLQLEGAIMRQELAYSLMGDDTEYNYTNSYFFDIEKARIEIQDFRAYARVKFIDILQVGGYFAYNQSVVRKGEMEYDVVFSDGSFDSFQDMDYEYDLLGGPRFPEDNDGATPGSKTDFGLTFGIETPTKNSLIFGLGYDMSLNNLLNNDYDGFNTSELLDIYPSREADLKVGFAYMRLGVRF